MIKNSLVLYKSNIAVIIEKNNDKFLIKFCTQAAGQTGKKAIYSEQRVREKDIILFHEGPISSLEKVLENAHKDFSSQIKETYELLQSDDSTASCPISLKELSEYALSKFDADLSWGFYNALQSSLEFSLNVDELKNGKIIFTPRTQKEIDLLNQKKYEKEHETEIRADFIKRLRERKLYLPQDAKFMGEVEAFALCKTEKSNILKEAGISQTIEQAHKVLIQTGIWDYTKNPYPTRFGFSFDSAREQLGPMKDEIREKVPCTCFAIDAQNSLDPDDAVGFDGEYIWVCIADPASTVEPNSKIDLAARERGTTLYIPEGASRMLCESSLEDYALGLREKNIGKNSCALAFKLKIDDNSQISSCEIKKVSVYVKMISYKDAEEQKNSSELKPLFEIARKNLERRNKNHAVTIQMPEVDIKVDKITKNVTIKPEEKYESNAMVQEMMLLAGEGAARFAFKNNIPFPYVSQESPEFPENIPDGWAGQFAKIKCMRKRSVGITPSPHAGLGLSFYSQVTSPLRRYSDLIAHEQLHAFIDGKKLLGKDEMLERISSGDAASIAAKKAARLSDTHWKLVYLLQNLEKTYKGFCIDIRGQEALFLIPELDMQTQILGCSGIKLNDEAELKAKNVDIPTQKVIFTRL